MIQFRFVSLILCLCLSLVFYGDSYAQDETYPVISVDNAHALQEIGMMGGDQGRIALSPDNQWMAIGGLEGVWLVNLTTNDDVRLLAGFIGKVNAVQFSPHNDLLASGGDDGVLRLWSLSDGELVRAIEAHTSPITGIDFNNTGEQIASASGGDDKTIRLHGVYTGEQIHVYADVRQGFRRVEFLNGSPFLIAATLNSSIAVWNLNDDSFQGEINDDFNGSVTSIATTDNGSHIAVGLSSGRIIIRNANNSEYVTLDHHEEAVLSVAYSPDGTMLAGVGRDNAVLILDATTGDIMARFELADFTYSVTFSRDSHRVYVTSNDGKITTWHINSQQKIEERTLRFSAVRQLAYSPDGQLVVALTNDSLARVFDASTHKQIAILKSPAGQTSTVAFHPVGRAIATAGDGGDVLVWRTDNFSLVDTLSTTEDHIYSVAFSPDPSVIATGSDDFLRLWNIRTKEPIMALDNNAPVEVLSFSPDGSLIATSGGLWNAFDRQKIDITLDEFASVAISPNSDLLATTEGFIPIKPNRVVSTADGYVGLNNTIIAFNPDGSLVAMGVGNNIQIIDVYQQAIVATITGHDGGVTSLAFSPDGSKLVSGGHDARIRQWAVAGVVPDRINPPPIRMDGLQLNTIPDTIPAPAPSPSAITAETIDQIETTITRHTISNVVDIDVAPDGTSVALASLGGVYLLDLENMTVSPKVLSPIHDAIFDAGLAVDYSTDGSMLAVSHGFAPSEEVRGGGITIWDVSGATPQLLNEFAIQGDRGFSIALGNQMETLAIGFDNAVAQILDIRDGSLITQTSETLFGRINGLSFNADDSILSLSDVTGNKAFFSTKSGQFLGGFNSGVAIPMQWSPDNTRLYSAEQTGFVLRNGSTIEPIRVNPYPDTVTGSVIATDTANGQLVVATMNTIWFLDFESGAITQEIAGLNNSVITAEVMRDGKKLIAVTNDNHLRVWDIASGEQITNSLLAIKDPLSNHAISADGRYIALGFDNRLRIVSTTSGDILHSVETVRNSNLTFVPNTSLLMASDNANMTDIWDVASGMLIQTITTDDEAIVGFSPRGTYLITQDHKLLTVQNIYTGAVLFDDVQVHLSGLADVDISLDETLMATVGEDNVLKLWDLESRTQIALLWTNQDNISQLSFASNEPWLAIMGDSGVRVYDYRRLINIDEQYVFSLPGNTDNGLYFSNDDSLLFGHEGNKLHIWSMENGVEVATLDIPNGYSSITSEGNQIVASDSEGAIHIYTINVEK